MVNINSFANLASSFGDPARASILQALLDGRALTSTELAGVAGVAPQTASGHLNQLTEAGLLKMEKQGRHRYFRLATPTIAQLFENLMQVTAEMKPLATRKVRTGPKDQALRTARTCFDHLAGQLGVAIADAMAAKGIIELNEDGGFVTDEGHAFLQRARIEFHQASPPGPHCSRMTCRPCLDWSERRPHLAGKLGAALCRHCFEVGWVRKREGSRALEITPVGQRAFHELFQFRIEAVQ
jgi:DNA-binding transcriptional ArsR family regulator